MAVNELSLNGFQNPNYFSGAGTSPASALNSSSANSSVSLFSEKYLSQRDNYRQKRESYSIAESARDEVLSNKISKVIYFIQEGKETKAMDAYNELLQEMEKQSRFAQLKNGDDDTKLRAVAKNLIENNANASLADLITENADNSFERGLKLTYPGESYTQEDMLKEMCDIDDSHCTIAKRAAGHLTRIGAFAGAGFLAGGPIGAAVGAGIGIISGIIF